MKRSFDYMAFLAKVLFDGHAQNVPASQGPHNSGCSSCVNSSEINVLVINPAANYPAST